MEIHNININDLFVSNMNVRKQLTSEEDETGIIDLAEDISTNGLINPITVRLTENNKYEIIAGQRRYLAMQHLKKNIITCHVIKVTDQKAEEISLVENVQRNQMTTCDKVIAYSKLYSVYNNDIDKVISAIHISKQTIQKYLKIKNLPENVLQMLDKSGIDKITLDVAVELTKLPSHTNYEKVLQCLNTLTTNQKIDAIKKYISGGYTEEDDFQDIKEDISLFVNDIKLAPSYPYVFENSTGKKIRIPVELYDDIIDLIKVSGAVIYC